MIVHHAWVVLLREDGTKSIIRANRNAEVRSGNCRALGDQLVGHPYGSTFEFREEDAQAVPHGPFKSLDDLNEKRAKKRKQPLKYLKLVRVPPTQDAFAILKKEDLTEPVAPGVGAEVIEEDETRDNRDYVQDPNNQKADSNSMRRAGATGSEIVRALAENLVTFNMKTKFSQEKYLTRLTRKHIPRVTVVRATSRTVAEVLFQKHQPNMASDPLRALRWVDSLPLVLSHGNVHAGAKCLVLDGTSGYLSLAILERLRPEIGGRLYFVGTTPREVMLGGGRPFIDLLNIPKVVQVATFMVCSSRRLEKGKVVREGINDEEAEQYNGRPQVDKEVKAIVGEESDKEENGVEEEEREGTVSEPVVVADAGSSRQQNPPVDNKRVKMYADEDWEALKGARVQRKLEMFNVLDVAGGGEGADSLLIAARHDPWEALELLLPHLALGRPFVVHHPCIEPLMNARAKLVESKAYEDLAVIETFCREYQVLPERTHPTMTGSAAGGFILRGIKVQPWGED